MFLDEARLHKAHVEVGILLANLASPNRSFPDYCLKVLSFHVLKIFQLIISMYCLMLCLIHFAQTEGESLPKTPGS